MGEHPDSSPAVVTRLLRRWQNGEREALDRLIPLVYDELSTLASRQLAREWRHDRLQTTAVVHEAYMRLFDQRDVDWQNRGHFFAIAAQVMRRILVDHAIRSKDDVTVGYRLLTTGESKPKLENSLNGKAKSDGEDILTPLILQAANTILTEVSR